VAQSTRVILLERYLDGVTFDDELRAAREKRAAARNQQGEDDAAEARRVDGLRQQARRQVPEVRVALRALEAIDPSSATTPMTLEGLYNWYAEARQATTPKRQKWWKAPPPRQPARWEISHAFDGVGLSYNTATKTFSFEAWSGTADELAERGEVTWSALSETWNRGSRNGGRIGIPQYFTNLIRVIAQVTALNEPG
jgi:hypothetical protein